MGKKVKSNDGSPQVPDSRLPPASYPSNSDSSSSTTDEEPGRGCRCFRHSKDSCGLEDLLLQIRYLVRQAAGCEKCSADPSGDKEKCMPLKKRAVAGALDPDLIWVCLDCCQCYCGGTVKGAIPPQGHAQIHAMQESHSWAAKFTLPTFCWCFDCGSYFMVEELQGLCHFVGSPIDEGDVVTDNNLEQGKGVEDSVSESVKVCAVRGLKNLGNTCYFNSVVQNLLAMEILQCCLVSLNGISAPLARELMNLFTETGDSSNSEGPANPEPLFRCICDEVPEYIKFQQQDSHELLSHLLHLLHKEELCARDSISGQTIVDNIFGGLLLSTVTCSDCAHTSESFEQFLDLSLPVPLKKPSAKKDPHSAPNRTTREPSPEMDPDLTPNKLKRKPSPRKDSHSTLDRTMGEGKRGAEAGGDKNDKDLPGIELCKTTGSGASDCYEPYASTSEPKQTAVMLEENPVGMRYSGATAIFHTADSVSWEFDLPVLQCSVREQICKDDNDVHSTSGSPCNVHPHPPEQTASSNSSGVSSCDYDSPSSRTQDSGVLKPRNEFDSTMEEILNRLIQRAKSTAVVCSVAKKLGAEAVSVTSCDQTKRVFGTISNLVNEPEVNSAPNISSGTFPEMRTTLCGGSSSEYYHGEFDHSTREISVDSCLVLFTNPELLSDGWICTHCNEKAPYQNDELRNSEQRATAMVDSSKAFESLVDVGQFIDPNVEVEVSHSPVSSIGRSSTLNCKDQQDKNENILEIPNLRFRSDACCQNILQKDDGSGGQHLTAIPSSLPDHQTPRSYSDNDNVSEVNQEGQYFSQLPDELFIANDIKDEEMESQNDQIKRTATKRILISQAPCILTIHLKRFIQDADGLLSKLDCHISFREVLDLTPYMDSSCEETGECPYHLLGLVEHSGTMTGGHYFAYVRKKDRPSKDENGVNPQWFRVSDDIVQEVSLSEVLKAHAYILFYERI